MFGFKSKILLFIDKIKWRHLNKRNSTYAVNSFPFSLVSVGNFTYGGIKVLNSNLGSKLRIGCFCSIAPEVTFILNSEHYTQNLSTFPFKVMCLHSKYAEAISYGDIIIDDDVWIGFGVTILSGVHIGQGSIIAAGSVVTRDIPPYSIVGGVPARIIKYRFSPDVIDYFLTFDYEKLSIDMVRNNIDILYDRIEQFPVSAIRKIFEWFPKKNNC